LFVFSLHTGEYSSIYLFFFLTPRGI
jgi:hypothetical protein